MSIAYEINRLQTSKADTKEQVNIDKDYINAGIDFIGSETVNNYDEKIQEMQEAYKAFIPVNTTSDTQIDAPKGGTIIGKTLKGNTSQSGTPTPSSPVPVNNVTGLQKIGICGKNLFDGQLEAGEYENSTGEKKSTADRYRNANFISVAPNTTYTFSIDGVSQKYVVYEYNKSKNFIRFLALESGTFTTSANTEYINFRNYAADYTADFTSLQIQLEKGSSATTYEEYQDTTLYMNKNKNLLKINDTSPKTINGITFTENSDGSIHAEGTATDLAFYGTNTLLPILPSQRYRLSGCPEGGSLSSYYISIMLRNESGSGIGSFADIGDGLFGDFIAPDSARYMYAQILILSGTTINATFYPQLELGSEITSYKEYEPLQEGNYEINLGKNLFDIDSAYHGIINASGVVGPNEAFRTTQYIATQPGKQYYFSSTQKSGQTNHQIYIAYYDNSKTFVSRTSYQQLSGSFTTPSNCYYMRAGIFTQCQENIMLEKGTQATSYSPYFEPIELNKIGNYQDFIKKGTGKNLFDKNNANILNGWLDNNKMALNPKQLNRLFYIQCKANTTYTISRSILTSTFRVATYDSEPFPTIGSSEAQYNVSGLIKDNSATSITITTGANAKYLIVHYGRLETDLNIEESLKTIQIEENSQATSYEPYGYKDKWYIEKNVGKVVLNGSRNWTKSGNTNIDRFVLSDYVDYGDTNCFSNYFDNGIYSDTNYIKNQIFLNTYSSTKRIIINYSTVGTTTLAQFKTWLQSNNTKVYYVLANTTYTLIENEELIEQLEEIIPLLEGQNNISVDGSIPVYMDLDYIVRADRYLIGNRREGK